MSLALNNALFSGKYGINLLDIITLLNNLWPALSWLVSEKVRLCINNVIYLNHAYDLRLFNVIYSCIL